MSGGDDRNLRVEDEFGERLLDHGLGSAGFAKESRPMTIGRCPRDAASTILPTMMEVQPTLPSVRVVTSPRRTRVYHEHRVAGQQDAWVQLRSADDRLVCPRCGLHEGFSARRP